MNARIDPHPSGSGVLARLAHVIARHRWPVIGIWLVLTLFGAFAAGKVSKRWYQSFSIPGYSAYEANQRTIEAAVKVLNRLMEPLLAIAVLLARQRVPRPSGRRRGHRGRVPARRPSGRSTRESSRSCCPGPR